VTLLEEREERPFRAALTNREHLRRYAGQPAHQPLSTLVALLDAWYAGVECDEDCWRQGSDAYGAVRRCARESVDAHAA